jgi:hypothetical protein
VVERPGPIASLAPVTRVEASRRHARGVPRLGGPARSAASALRRHWALVALLAVAAALRILALVAIYPGIWFSDTNDFVQEAATGVLSHYRVGGYALLVWPFYQLGSAAALIVLQHLIGLAIVVTLYALLVHRGAPRWLAVVAMVPVALDAYVLAIEHAIMSDTLFDALVVAVVTLLLWSDRLSLGAAAAAGLLLGYAGVVRSAGVPFVAVFVIYLLVRRVGWRPLVAFCAGCALVTAAYATMFDIQHGRFALTTYSGRFLYARTAQFANCSELGTIPADERKFCPDPRRPRTLNAYLWGQTSPIHGLPPSADPRVRDFAMRVIRHRPLAYARSVASNVVHYFEPGHRIGRNDYAPVVWEFPTDPSDYGYPGFRGPIRPGSKDRRLSVDPNEYISRMTGRPHTNGAASRVLRFYQLRLAYTSGQVLALCLAVVLAALLLRRRIGWRYRIDAALLAAAVLVALTLASALSVFSYRYGLTAVVLLPPAAALAATGMLRRATAA